MSRLFILFLIALLPLRGWTAEHMAVQMGGTAAQAQGVGMTVDCALHMQMAVQAAGALASAQPGSAASHHQDHKACQSCQLCMPLAALDTQLVLLPVAPTQAVPLAFSSRFASADAVRCAKPPIS